MKFQERSIARVQLYTSTALRKIFLSDLDGMKNNKPLRIDITGLRAPSVSIAEVLAKGSPDEVREHLTTMGSLLLAGIPLSAAETAWLGNALVAIGSGAGPEVVMRVKSGKRKVLGLRAQKARQQVLDDLAMQGEETESRREGALIEALMVESKYQAMLAMRPDKDRDQLWVEAAESIESELAQALETARKARTRKKSRDK